MLVIETRMCCRHYAYVSPLIKMGRGYHIGDKAEPMLIECERMVSFRSPGDADMALANKICKETMHVDSAGITDP